MSEVQRKTVAVAMSGGVDSSVAAALLQQQGYDVIGLTMHLWDYDSVGGNDNRESSCCSVESMNDARAVCHKLAIPHYVLNLNNEFEHHVIRNFIDEYLAGRTPNPCIRCNVAIKWGVLFDKAVSLGADFFSTGHYARVMHDKNSERHLLLKARFKEKDQAYCIMGFESVSACKDRAASGRFGKERSERDCGGTGIKDSIQIRESRDMLCPG